MNKRTRFYDGYGNELRIETDDTEKVKIAVNLHEIEVPLKKLLNMLNANKSITGKHVKYEIREDV